MPLIAVQTIAGSFGTFHAGDPIDDDIHPDVRDAWLAAGIIEEAPAEATDEAVEKPKPVKPSKATAPKPEKPQRRFVEKAVDAPQERMTTGPEA